MIIFLTLPQNHRMATETLQQGAIQAKLSLTMGTSPIASPSETQQHL
jgi:hypothetical protein